MRYALLITAAFVLNGLGGCDTPGPEFWGIKPQRITVQDVAFDVRIAAKRAEAIRLNSQWAPRLAAAAPQAVAAIEQVSGCRVRALAGDAARMTAWLDCGQALAPLPRSNSYDCDVYEIADGPAELTCEALPY